MDDVKQREQKHFKQYRTAKQKLSSKENLVRFLHRGKPTFFDGFSCIVPIRAQTSKTAEERQGPLRKPMFQ